MYSHQSRHLLASSIRLSSRTTRHMSFQPSYHRCMAMKPGTPIPGLDIYKDKDAPVAMERSEYPEWVNNLSQPLISLAKLRRMNLFEAEDKDQRRYLKLIRRQEIRKGNESRAK
jgi:hypothetical protein